MTIEPMSPSSGMLRPLLLICVAYFLAMACAHFLGLKYPLLFVYYDTPYHAYQDRIISFMLVTYAILFFAAARIREMVPYALVAIWVTVAGLSYINQSNELALVLKEQSAVYYWLQTALFGAISAVLTLLYLRERNTK